MRIFRKDGKDSGPRAQVEAGVIERAEELENEPLATVPDAAPGPVTPLQFSAEGVCLTPAVVSADGIHRPK